MKHTGMGQSLDQEQPTDSHFPKENDAPSHNSPQSPMVPPLGVEPYESPHPCCCVDRLASFEGLCR